MFNLMTDKLYLMSHQQAKFQIQLWEVIGNLIFWAKGAIMI